jgi:16S rRNA (guanine527-N7)-methyltransferase
MIPRNGSRELLSPFEISLSDDQIDKMLIYLGLLLRWNEKINLTSIRTPEECVTRHFGESLLLSKIVPLTGRLLDIGSGAGFPGLAIKLVAPELEVVLLEPVGKKRAFLKEIVRACGMASVHVIGYTLQEFSRTEASQSFDIITERAVGGFESLIPLAVNLLRLGGHLCLWVGKQQTDQLLMAAPELQWCRPVPIPLSQEREILTGSTLHRL